ncbi:hypothetical protein LCGC14_0408970 [marine sediment metagenome]|uniref:Uncharacterized protein n=1 Tax=marine sediment metagenome TaxID=412755 RepID=A0A0F9SUK2_9ZZZZ
MQVGYKPKRSRIVRIPRNHPYYETSNKGNISETRLAYATYQGYNLTSEDFIVCKDGDPYNTEISNLIKTTRENGNMITRKARFLRIISKLLWEIDIIDGRLTSAGINPNTLEADSDRSHLVDAHRRIVDTTR